MAVFNANTKFAAHRSKSIPVQKVPKNVRQFLNIDKLYRRGVAKIEPGKKGCLYDRCYLFEDINYINKDDGGKVNFLNQFMGWLKSMNVDFKISVTNEYQSMDEFLEKVKLRVNSEDYPEIEEGLDHWIHEKIEDANPNVTTLRYLTVSCRADHFSEANIILNALDTTICDWFRIWKSRIIRLTGEERLRCLHSLLRVGKKEEQDYISYPKVAVKDWKNDILPKDIRQHSNYMELDDVFVSVLFGWKFRKSIDSDTFIRSFSHVEFPSFVTLDFAPVGPDVIEDKLIAASMNNEKEITKEEDRKRRNSIISNGPSYQRQRKKDYIEGYMTQVSENDETGFFMNLLIVVTAQDEETLGERVAQMQAIGRKEGVIVETADWNQMRALNTALPFAGRQVDYMRFVLSSSVVAFQPYYAQDVIEPGGYMYGLNRTTKRLILGNRKLLMSPHGIIIGHTGSGKSVIIKTTEVAQTLISTDDDILILDPQNEFQDIIEENGGVFFDLTPKSKIYLNGFEVSEEVFAANKDRQEQFVAVQIKYAKSLVAAMMKNIVVTQEHYTVVSRCTRRMFDQIFAQKKLKKQPTLRLLRAEIKKELDNVKNPHDETIIRPIYNSMEEYTEGACDMLAHPSTVRMDKRMVGFGLKNVPEDNWEAVMLTVMHYTSTRMEYNQDLQRATHFIVDETQIVCKKGTSADQLNTAVATFRKFGGICTMAMQNLTAALKNDQLVELFSNCSYKCFLDQGGVDANALAEIQELSETEFNALSEDKPGQGVMVWGKKVIIFDAEISKDNVLYRVVNTNFHEKAEKTKARERQEASVPNFSTQTVRQEEEQAEEQAEERRAEQTPAVSPPNDRTEEIILSMAALSPITSRDVLSVLEITQEEAEKQLEYLCRKQQLERIEEAGMIRFRKAG